MLAQLEAQLAELPPEHRDAARRQLQAFAELSPAEQQAALAAGQQAQIDQQAAQIIAAANDAIRDDRLDELLPALDEAAAHFAEREADDSDNMQLAQFSAAVAAHLRGEAPLPVPVRFVELFASLGDSA